MHLQRKVAASPDNEILFHPRMFTPRDHDAAPAGAMIPSPGVLDPSEQVRELAERRAHYLRETGPARAGKLLGSSG